MVARLYALSLLGVPQRVKGDSMNKVSYHIDELPPLTAKQQADLEHLATLSDDDIDLSDIPEATDWSGAIRGSIRTQASSTEPSVISPSILAKFKDRAKQTGGDYQEMINNALEEYLTAIASRLLEVFLHLAL